MVDTQLGGPAARYKDDVLMYSGVISIIDPPICINTEPPTFKPPPPPCCFSSDKNN